MRDGQVTQSRPEFHAGTFLILGLGALKDDALASQGLPCNIE